MIFHDNICHTCKQDMRAKPHEGLNGKNCPQCGQGLKWRKAAELRKKKVRGRDASINKS